MIFLMALAMFGIAAAQTTHQVGDALGWVVPPGGDAAYAKWASTKTFRVGDILVFNFTTGTHSVAEVSKEAYGGCTTTNPISVSTTGPTSLTITTAGEHFYLCTFPGHCGFGQKLSINVSASSSPSPAPQPSVPTPSPVPAPEPTPPTEAPAPSPSEVDAPSPSPASGGSIVYVVGDAAGWAVPVTGISAYQTWASGKSFKVGDVLVFNFANGAHNVAEVTKANFDSCNTSSPIATVTRSPARINLRETGEHHYICTITGHCSSGQKLAINVTSAGSTTPPSSGATPPSSDGLSPPGATNPDSPSGNSAPSSFAAATLPITLLSIALAYLY